MPSVCLHFHVHQPRLLKHYTFFDIGHDHVYEDTEKNLQILNTVSDTWYLPANNIVFDLIRQYKGISGSLFQSPVFAWTTLNNTALMFLTVLNGLRIQGAWSS
jgi:hypothetical protein